VDVGVTEEQGEEKVSPMPLQQDQLLLVQFPVAFEAIQEPLHPIGRVGNCSNKADLVLAGGSGGAGGGGGSGSGSTIPGDLKFNRG
jgi:hypothetical protein